MFKGEAELAMKNMKDSSETKITRRSLIKTGGAAVAAGTMLQVGNVVAGNQDMVVPSGKGKAASQLDEDVKVTHSVCLGCNARCGTRQVVRGDRLVKMTGNPYHPYNSMAAPIAYDTPVEESLHHPSPVCGKAHDAMSYVYNDRRITVPLKRAGARGEGKFEPISWEQLIEEIAHGGELFAHLGEKRQVPGLDACLSDDPIDQADPGLGPKRNSFVCMSGRMQAGRKAFIDRFVKNSVGSINRIGHTDICGLGFRMGNFALTEGKQVELKADPWSAEYILVFGANVYEALQPGLNTYGAAMAKRSSKGEVQFTIVDPRAQNASVHAESWLPVKPGQDGALAMGMIRWMLDNNKINTAYLELPNKEKAMLRDHSCYSNASHLVITDDNHADHGRFLRVKHLYKAAPAEEAEDYMVMTEDGQVAAASRADKGVLEVQQTVTGVDGISLAVASSFSLMKASVLEKSVEEYAAIAGIEVPKLVATAEKFAAHGSKAAVCQYHGAGNYCNGSYGAYAVAMLNVLVGSVGMKGGYLNSGGGYASWKSGEYDMGQFPGKRKPSGVRISREKAKYESSAEFARKKAETGSGYPAERPWFPFTKGGLSVETLSGIDGRYPYGIEVLFTYFYNPVYSTPGGYRFKETLIDSEKVPLHVSIDIAVNESNIYADYIVPDVTYLEGQYGWLTPHAPALRFTGVRLPCIEPLTGRTEKDKPMCLETFFIDLAAKLNLPGFGEKSIPAADGGLVDFYEAEDFYLRAYANIAANAKLAPASEGECRFVENNYPLAKFKDKLSAGQWRQFAYMAARGGVFAGYEDVFDGSSFRRSVERVVLYNEKLAATRNSLTGARFSGTLGCESPHTAGGENIAELDADFPFTIITYKMNVHTQSRTGWHQYAMEIFPENHIQINSADAERYKLQSGDRVRLVSASNGDGILGTIMTTEMIRPGCLGISFHYGHSQAGAADLEIKDGEKVFLGGSAVVTRNIMRGDASLGTGTNPNMVARLDDGLGNTPLVDVLAGIPDFSSTRVKLEKLG